MHVVGLVCFSPWEGVHRCEARRCDKLGIAAKLKAEDRDLVGKPLMKRIMQAWLPAHEVRTLRPRRQAAGLQAAQLVFAVTSST